MRYYIAAGSCWKQNTCIQCGETFRYMFSRRAKGGNGRRAEDSLLTRLDDGADIVPCPTCGFVQPDMRGTRLAGAHAIWAAVCAVLGIVLALIGLDQNPSCYSVMLGTSLLAAVLFVGQFAVLFYNPNRNLDRNKRYVESQREKLFLQTLGDGKVAPRALPFDPPPLINGRQWIGVGILVSAICLALVPELQRRLCGWPINEIARPRVVGPGDTARIEMPGAIQSIYGLWTGEALAQVANSAETGATMNGVEATTRTETWGERLDLYVRTTTPWVDVTIPDSAGLAGKTLQLDLFLNIRYPEEDGPLAFKEVSQTIRSSATLRLAPLGAGEFYSRASCWCVIGSVGLMLFGTLWLHYAAERLRKQAGRVHTYRLSLSAPFQAVGVRATKA